MAQNNSSNNNSNNSSSNYSSTRGFAGMDSDRQRSIASMGGMSQGKGNNPGNFANNPDRAREAGKRGGQSRGDAQNRRNTEESNSANKTLNRNDNNNLTDEA